MKFPSLIFILLLTALVSCKNSPKPEAENKSAFENFVVKETIAAGGYIYLLGEQGDSLKWFAITEQDAKVGDVFYYTEPLVMKDFYSKELNRPFEEVVFLMKVSKNPSDLGQTEAPSSMPTKSSGKITTEKQELSIEIPKDAISIGQLYENLQKYEGKKIKIRGEVVKYSEAIMNTNWVHIQDGTSFNDKYDLTITTKMAVNVQDIVTFEGVVVLNKDFGYGYFYEVLIENATIVN